MASQASSTGSSLASDDGRRVVLLVGGGHSHVQVMTHLHAKLSDDEKASTRLILLSDGETAYYSGMLPGCVAELYEPSDIQIHLPPLARATGFEWIDNRVVGCDPEAQVVMLADGGSLAYDVVSFDVGSVTRGVGEVPGVLEHSLSTRPINRLLGRVARFEREHPAFEADPNLLVVGGGPAGFELALCFEARMRNHLGGVRVTLACSSDDILPAAPDNVRRAGNKEMDERGVDRITGVNVVEILEHEAVLDNGERMPFDLLVWATGPSAPPFLQNLGLALDDRGYILVRDTLQAQDYANVFAVGDCNAMIDYPDMPRAGVYAVRMGPILGKTMQKIIQAGGDAGAVETMPTYKPQTGFLSLLATGEGSAIGMWKGWCFQNTWMWSLKDYIDRKFMAQFPHPDRDLDVEEPLDAPDTTYAVPDITAIAETS